MPPGSSCRKRIQNCRDGSSINWGSSTTQGSGGKCERRAFSPKRGACMILLTSECVN